MVDWGAGHYEHTSRQLWPVAEHVVDVAGIGTDERALDLGCGTGNAALLAARRGAIATGLDPAARLLEVARERAASESVEVDWVIGSAEDLPFDDASFDAVVSIFGVIFASDPERAIAEIVRVLRPGGRALITAWIPEGAIDAMIGVMRRGVAEVTGSDRRGSAWHDVETVEAMATRHGAVADFEPSEVAFEGESPEAYFALEEANHPMSLAMRPVLEGAGIYERVRSEAISVLREGNENPEAFRVSSPYRIFRLRPRRPDQDSNLGPTP